MAASAASARSSFGAGKPVLARQRHDFPATLTARQGIDLVSRCFWPQTTHSVAAIPRFRATSNYKHVSTRFWRGVYALIIAFIALVVIVAMVFMQVKITTIFSKVGKSLT